jgi:predicted NUDIX family phosphoesterase
MSESILCVPAALVAKHCRTGFGRPERAEALVATLNSAGRFLPRDEVETDETWRQIIPYLLLRRAGGGYFAYRRLPASGEARLVDLHSLGVGGHINDQHLVPGLAAAASLRPNLVADGLQRELAEELVWPEDATGAVLRLHGFLSLDATPVDRVHVGVVGIVDLPDELADKVTIRETDKLAAVGWLTPVELGTLAQQVPFEGWSRTLIEAGLP